MLNTNAEGLECLPFDSVNEESANTAYILREKERKNIRNYKRGGRKLAKNHKETKATNKSSKQFQAYPQLLERGRRS
jgi:hypothetical protein